MNATTYMQLALGLAVVVALVVVRWPRRCRPSPVVEELGRKARQLRVTLSLPYAALKHLTSRRRQRQRDAAAGKYEIPPFLRGDVGQPDLQAQQNEPQAARTRAAVPCLPR